jgi:hypothetical protein
MNICAMCPRYGERCSGCKNVYYCCRSHQKDDWPVHKLVCKKFALRGSRSPDWPLWVLHFPVDRSEPEFKLLQIPRKWHARAIRVNGCSPDCRCLRTTYAKYFTSPLNHTRECRFIYIGAPEQSVDSREHDPRGLEVNQCIKSLTGDTLLEGTCLRIRS